MPTRVLLEGPAIEPLLAQVRDEYGASIRIISADKVRSGGFGGFFAKRHYELSVEVPDADERPPTPQRRPPAADEPAQTLEQLLTRAESRDRITPGAGPVAADRLADRDAGMGDSEGAVGGPDFGTAGRAGADPGATFAALMVGLDRANSFGRRRKPAPRHEATDPDRPDGPTVRPLRPAQVTGSPVNGADSGAGARPLPPVPSLAELMGGLGVSEAAAQPPATLPPTAQPPATLRPPHADQVRRNLMMVGMPEAMAAEIVGGDTYAGVLGVLAARPSAPDVPAAPGEILVLCGDLDHALPIGRTLCEQAGIDQEYLLLGGPAAAGTGIDPARMLGDPPTAATQLDRLQNADHPWIVVVHAPVGGTDPIWISDMRDAVGATAVWAIVDATRKTADTARHLRALGEVEALVVHGVDTTMDPATVLGLDLPIVSLDGKPATPHSWAALLCARIAADVVPIAARPRRPARGSPSDPPRRRP